MPFVALCVPGQLSVPFQASMFPLPHLMLTLHLTAQRTLRVGFFPPPSPYLPPYFQARPALTLLSFSIPLSLSLYTFCFSKETEGKCFLDSTSLSPFPLKSLPFLVSFQTSLYQLASLFKRLFLLSA